MAQLVKHIDIDSEMEDIIRTSTIEPVSGSSGFMLRLPQQLERKLYERIMKILEAEGGKWNRQAKGHLFTHDPRERLGLALEAGELEVVIVKEGWFPTPRPIVEQMLDLAPWEGGEIGEFSAGEGAIAERIVERWPEAELYLLCIEKNAQRAGILQAKGFSTLQTDFTEAVLPPVFSRVYMNPPFENSQDIDHVIHAFGLLAPGGELVSIMSEATFFREDRKHRDFREILKLHQWDNFDLPEQAFKSSGTNVRARMVHLKNEE